MKALAASISKSLASRQPVFEINAEKLKVLRDNDAVKTLTRMYSTFVSDDDMSNLPDFFRDIDQVFVKYKGTAPVSEDELTQFETDEGDTNSTSEEKPEKKDKKTPIESRLSHYISAALSKPKYTSK